MTDTHDIAYFKSLLLQSREELLSLEEIRNVLQFRSHYYQAATDKRVKTDGKPIEAVVEEIIELVKIYDE